MLKVVIAIVGVFIALVVGSSIYKSLKAFNSLRPSIKITLVLWNLLVLPAAVSFILFFLTNKQMFFQGFLIFFPVMGLVLALFPKKFGDLMNELNKNLPSYIFTKPAVVSYFFIRLIGIGLFILSLIGIWSQLSGPQR